MVTGECLPSTIHRTDIGADNLVHGEKAAGNKGTVKLGNGFKVKPVLRVVALVISKRTAG